MPLLLQIYQLPEEFTITFTVHTKQCFGRMFHSLFLYKWAKVWQQITSSWLCHLLGTKTIDCLDHRDWMHNEAVLTVTMQP